MICNIIIIIIIWNFLAETGRFMYNSGTSNNVECSECREKKMTVVSWWVNMHGCIF